MKQASLTHLRRNLSTMLNAVNNDREPLIVTRRRGKPVVMLSLEDYQALGKPAPRQIRSDSLDSLVKSFDEVDEMRFVPQKDISSKN